MEAGVGEMVIGDSGSSCEICMHSRQSEADYNLKLGRPQGWWELFGNFLGGAVEAPGVYLSPPR